jgi:membrane-bound lytic murein transglycosylase B
MLQKRKDGSITRRTVFVGLGLACLGSACVYPKSAAAGDGSFGSFLKGLRPAALQSGVQEALFDRMIDGLEVDPAVIALSRKQSEFTRPFWAYVDGAVSPQRLRQGASAVQRASPALGWAEKHLGVERSVVAGIWGMESNFGTATGDKDVLRSTASLAFGGYRDPFYINEFLAALRIVQDGDIERAGLLGSWAGAMGQTQFIPSSFLKYALDADGDGRKNIWTSPADALASAANHLHLDGWTQGLPWGFEVVVPKGFDFAFADRMARHRFSALSAQGLLRPGGAALPTHGSGGLFLPTGLKGPAFVITDNFEVIRKYNTSDAYALAVGLLGDRLFGAAPLSASWPKDIPQLQARELTELQQRLKALGLPMAKIDGKLGWQTRQGVQAVQRKLGDVPDGHPTQAFLKAVRAM